MKLYISTPINGRKEPSFSEKYNAAKARIKEIESKYKDILSEYDTIVTTFDINPSGVTEAGQGCPGRGSDQLEKGTR